MATDKQTNAARVRKLEQLANNKNSFDFRVIWDHIPDSELEPGTLVIMWGNNGEITSHKVKREGKANAKSND